MIGENRVINQRRGIISILILFVLISCSDGNSKYTPVDKFDPERNAINDIELAKEEAQRTDKNIILDVGGEWCIWCHRLDAFLEEHQELTDFIEENYIIVKINYSPENKNEEVLAQYPPVAGYPHLFVLDSNGNFLYSQNTGDFEVDKSYGVDKIMAFLEKWAPEK